MGVEVFEQSNDILSSASGNNQFRLHQGFHYARNHRTRIQSREGYGRFIERYARLSAPIGNNIYAVPHEDSLIDYLTYRIIMSASGLEFTEVNPLDYGIANCTGGLRVHERKLLTSKARQHFAHRLAGSLSLNHKVTDVVNKNDCVFVDGVRFDYAIDATWGALASHGINTFFEPTVLLYYQSESVGDFALTTVDGPLCSIYPCEEPSLYTLSSVPHTPLGRFDSSEQSWAFLNELTSDMTEDKRIIMEKQIIKYFPNFKDKFEYVGPQFSVKTKISGSTDDRSCYVSKDKRLFRVLSGKIDTIFHASDTILSMIEAESEFKEVFL